jgi:hypothetical protein
MPALVSIQRNPVMIVFYNRLKDKGSPQNSNSISFTSTILLYFMHLISDELSLLGPFSIGCEFLLPLTHVIHWPGKRSAKFGQVFKAGFKCIMTSCHHMHLLLDNRTIVLLSLAMQQNNLSISNKSCFAPVV